MPCRRPAESLRTVISSSGSGGLFCRDGPLAHRHDQVSDLEEFARLFAVVRASPRNRALFLTAYRHGLRASEVGLLRTDDIDFRALRIMVHRLKGSHSGTHPMQPDEAKALRAYLRGQLSPRSPILFPSNRGDLIARRTPLRYPANHATKWHLVTRLLGLPRLMRGSGLGSSGTENRLKELTAIRSRSLLRLRKGRSWPCATESGSANA